MDAAAAAVASSDLYIADFLEMLVYGAL